MRILNFGSLNIDKTYHVDHLVLPGETISSDSLAVNCGGKGIDVRNAVIWVIGFALYRYLMTVDLPLGNTLTDMLATVIICVGVDKIKK